MAVAGGGPMPVENDGGRRSRYLKGRAALFLETTINLSLAYIKSGDIDNPIIYSKVCKDLGNSIDLAIAMNEVPSTSHLLPLIFKEVYRRKSELFQLQPLLMMLVLSIKGACTTGWFPEKDVDDLLKMAKEVSYGFCDTGKMSIEPSYALNCLSTIIPRFYPKLKLDGILASFDVKAGYGAFVADFHISRGTLPPHYRSLWLLVAGTDNMDTSACIYGPAKADFLLNGKGIPGRTKNDMGKGPQFPTKVSKMTKFGVNMLQAIGDFDGQYIVVIAFMSLISLPDPPQLKDYVHPVLDADNSDADVIEMSSRISLNCPISRRRIRTPVKGHLCRHPQCFDYKNFMDLNSRKPFWRCPHCNQPVCHLDIRIDQNIVKILNEVAEDVDDVIISADGSWKAVFKTDESSKTNSDTVIDQERGHNHVSAAENPISVEANDTLHNSSSALHNSATSTSTVNSLAWLPPGTLDAISDRLQQFENDRRQRQATSSSLRHLQPGGNPSVTHPVQLQDQPSRVDASSVSAVASSSKQNQLSAEGTPVRNFVSNEMVNTPLSKQQNGQHPDAVNSNTAQASNESARLVVSTHGQSQYVNTDGTAQANATIPRQTRSTVAFTPVQLTPPSTSNLSDVQRESRAQVTSTTQQMKNVGPALTVQHTSASGDGMPSGRMRGSLRGEDLAAARRQFLSPPQQPARATQTWSRPASTIPIAMQMQELLTNTTNSRNMMQELLTNTTNSQNKPMAQSNEGVADTANLPGTVGSLPQPSQGMH